MSTIWNITPSFIQAFEIVHSVKKLSQGEMFKRLSFMMGGDGQTITKKQLDNYIKQAEKGEVTVTKMGLTALKVMQENWDKISGGKDSITAADLKDYASLLTMAFAGSFSMSKSTDASESDSDKESTAKEINKTIKDAQANKASKTTDTSASDTNNSQNKTTDKTISPDSTAADLTSMLNKILGGTSDTNDDSNADLIGTLTNMIAITTSISTVSVEA